MLCACDLLFDDQDLARLRNYALAEGVDAGNTRALVAAILLDSAGGRRAAGSFAAVAAADEAAYDMSKESMAAVMGYRPGTPRWRTACSPRTSSGPRCVPAAAGGGHAPWLAVRTGHAHRPPAHGTYPRRRAACHVRATRGTCAVRVCQPGRAAGSACLRGTSTNP